MNDERKVVAVVSGFVGKDDIWWDTIEDLVEELYVLEVLGPHYQPWETDYRRIMILGIKIHYGPGAPGFSETYHVREQITRKKRQSWEEVTVKKPSIIHGITQDSEGKIEFV